MVLLCSVVAKISVSLEDDLYSRVRDAAGSDGVSGWLAAAADARLRAEALREVADEIAQATGGPYSEREIGEARGWLPSSSTRAA
jgi:hypothetical protein